MKAEFAMFVLPLLFVAAILQVTPLLTRRGIFFSATVEPDFPQSADGRRLLRSYRMQVTLWSVLAILTAILLMREHPLLASLAPTYALVIAVGVTYWQKFREVHARYGTRKAEIRQADLSSTRESFSPLLWVPPFLAIVLTAFYLQSHWNQIPQQFPVHWGADGQPNRWSSRDWLGVYGPLLMGIGMNLFFLGFAWFLSRQARKTAMRYVTVRMLEFLLYPVTFTFVMVALLPLVGMPLWLIPLVMTVSVAGVLYWAYRRITAPATDAVPEPQSDSYWKAGVFYYNPNDPAIFVSKRVGVGYTMNFANKWSWIALGVTFVAIAASLYFGKHASP